MKKEYSTSEVTITWEPHKCIHSKNCISGLSSVFDFEKRPWINAQGASTKTIVKQIDNCPSGALGYYFAEQKEKSTGDVESEKSIEVIPNGPLMVYGHLQVKLPNGQIKNQSKVSAFCRCGASLNKPFCDGSHKKIGSTTNVVKTLYPKRMKVLRFPKTGN